MIVLRPITRDKANAAIRRWHRHHKPVRSHRFAVSALVDGDLAGVVIVGNPQAQALDDGTVFEVTRLATPENAVKNVATRLLGSVRRSSLAMGVRLLVSYTRIDESGTCYRAAGWVPVAIIQGRGWDSGNKGARWLPGFYEATTEIIDRVRWETGPDARPEHPTLVWLGRRVA